MKAVTLSVNFPITDTDLAQKKSIIIFSTSVSYVTFDSAPPVHYSRLNSISINNANTSTELVQMLNLKAISKFCCAYTKTFFKHLNA